jgi:hypothetical protein
VLENRHSSTRMKTRNSNYRKLEPFLFFLPSRLSQALGQDVGQVLLGSEYPVDARPEGVRGSSLLRESTSSAPLLQDGHSWPVRRAHSDYDGPVGDNRLSSGFALLLRAGNRRPLMEAGLK